MKKRILILGATLGIAVSLVFGGYAYGLNIYQKTLDAMGFMNLTDELVISELEIDDIATLKVTTEPNGNTQADVTYAVHVYLDGVDTAQQTASWTGSEITSVTKKKLTFTGLDLASAIAVKVEVTH